MPRQPSPLSSQRLLLALLGLIAMLNPVTAAVICSREETRRKEDCTTLEVTHLRQFHDVEGFGATPEDMMTKVAHSQLEIAKYIAKHPDAIVVEEGRSKDHPFGAGSTDISMRDIAKVIFPEELPDSWRGLDKLQKEFLWDRGGAETAMYLGKLAKIYKSISPELAKRCRTEMDAHNHNIKRYSAMGRFEEYMDKSGLNKLIMDKREKEAMTYVVAAAQEALSNPERSATKTLEIILIYGKKHNFKKYCKKAGYMHKAIDFSGLELEDYQGNTEEQTVTPYKPASQLTPHRQTTTGTDISPGQLLPIQITANLYLTFERKHYLSIGNDYPTPSIEVKLMHNNGLEKGYFLSTEYQMNQIFATHDNLPSFLAKAKTLCHSAEELVKAIEEDLAGNTLPAPKPNFTLDAAAQTTFRRAHVPLMLMDAEPTRQPTPTPAP